jgi:hypothetical protein
VWFAPQVALVTSGGNYPVDYAQGLPGGTFVTLGLRIATRRPGYLPVTERERLAGSRNAAAPLSPTAPSLDLHPESGGRVRFRIQAPGATRVELMGDFTDWQAVVLDRQGSSEWTATLTASPGLHRMNLRIDGGPWTVPAGIATVRDEFSGVVGIITVP